MREYSGKLAIFLPILLCCCHMLAAKIICSADCLASWGNLTKGDGFFVSLGMTNLLCGENWTLWFWLLCNSIVVWFLFRIIYLLFISFQKFYPFLIKKIQCSLCFLYWWSQKNTHWKKVKSLYFLNKISWKKLLLLITHSLLVLHRLGFSHLRLSYGSVLCLLPYFCVYHYLLCLLHFPH